MITEDQLKQLCLEWFREGAYQYVYGLSLAYNDTGVIKVAIC